MKYFSLFSGIGGFELGIQYAYEELCNLRPIELEGSERPKKHHNIKNELQQWECVGYSEIDKHAVQIYKKHFNYQNYGDITKINATELPDFDLLVGGFPCQSFSIAGKRGGFDDTRGSLFFEFARIAQEKRPSYFLLENVKGLLSSDKGRTFGTILATLDEIGYDCQWEVLNSKNFGVPQNRERVYIVGHLRGQPRPQVFPIGQSEELSNEKDEGEQRKRERISSTIDARYGALRNAGETYIKQVNNPKHSNDRVYSKEGVSPSLNTMQGGRRQPFIAPVLTPDRKNKRQDGRRFKESGEPSFSPTAQDKHGIYNGTKIRRLTPVECERLQGFPDGWAEGLSDTQRYKVLGNAVTVNVIRDIMIKLLYE